jgi:hypothetical protein
MNAYEAGHREPVDEQALEELDLYANNTSELYPQKQAILRNIQRRIKNGTYDPSLAPKLWLYWVDNAAKMYASEFAERREWSRIFSPATREALAKRLARREFMELNAEQMNERLHTGEVRENRRPWPRPSAREDAGPHGALDWKQSGDSWVAETFGGAKYKLVPEADDRWHTWYQSGGHKEDLGVHGNLGAAMGAARRHQPRMSKAAEGPYVRKTEDEYVLQGKYAHGWEDLTAEKTWKEIKARRREYIENEGGKYRIVHHRVRKTPRSAPAASEARSSSVPLPLIRTTFSRMTPESVEQGDFSETGWIDEDGVSMVPYDEDMSAVDMAVKFLRYEGVVEASSMQFHKGIWYSTEWSVIDYGTGEEEERSFHLEGFTEEQEREIFNELFAKRARPGRRTAEASEAANPRTFRGQWPHSPDDRYILSHDGKRVMSGTSFEIAAYIHRMHSYSVDHALKYEGYSVRPESEGASERVPVIHERAAIVSTTETTTVAVSGAAEDGDVIGGMKTHRGIGYEILGKTFKNQRGFRSYRKYGYRVHLGMGSNASGMIFESRGEARAAAKARIDEHLSHETHMQGAEGAAAQEDFSTVSQAEQHAYTVGARFIAPFGKRKYYVFTPRKGKGYDKRLMFHKAGKWHISADKVIAKRLSRDSRAIRVSQTAKTIARSAEAGRSEVLDVDALAHRAKSAHDGSIMWVEFLPGDGGKDWGYTRDSKKAVPLSPHWQRRFRKYMESVNDGAVFIPAFVGSSESHTNMSDEDPSCASTDGACVAIIERAPGCVPTGIPMETPADLYTFLAPRYSKLGSEHFFVLLVSNQGELLGAPIEIARGQADRVAVDIEQIVAAAITGAAAGARGFIVSHCHPSGGEYARPSPADKRLTEDIRRSAEIACPSTAFIDHVIVAAPSSKGVGSYYSFQDKKTIKVNAPN